MIRLRRTSFGVSLLAMLTAFPLEATYADGPYLVVSSRRLDSARGVVPTYGVTRNDFRHMAELATVRVAAPIRALRTQVRSRAQQTDAVVIGTTDKLLNFIRDRFAVRIQSGRYLSSADVAAGNNVAVLADAVAREIWGESDPIVQNVRVYGHCFLVVGTFRGKNDATSGKALPGGMHIPVSTMRARFGDTFVSDEQGRREGVRFELSQVWLEPTTPSALAPTRRMVESLLEQTHETTDYSIDMVR